MAFNYKNVLIFLILGLIVYVGYMIYYPKNNVSIQMPMATAPGSGPAMAKPTASCAMNPSKDIDRQPLVKEIPELISANEIIQMNYKGFDCDCGVDKEFYTNDKPLFDLEGPVNLTPLDINGANRRVNFY